MLCKDTSQLHNPHTDGRGSGEAPMAVGVVSARTLCNEAGPALFSPANIGRRPELEGGGRANVSKQPRRETGCHRP